MSRLPELAVAALTPEQRKIFDEIVSRRGNVPAPHKIWLLNPGIAPHTNELGWYFQNHSSLPASLYELTILLVGRQWRADFVWESHVPRARAAGLADDVIQALGEGRKPAFPAENAPEAVIIDFVEQLHARHEIEPKLYDRAVALLGVNGVIDLTSLVGYFTMIASVLKVFEVGK